MASKGANLFKSEDRNFLGGTLGGTKICFSLTGEILLIGVLNSPPRVEEQLRFGIRAQNWLQGVQYSVRAQICFSCHGCRGAIFFSSGAKFISEGDGN